MYRASISRRRFTRALLTYVCLLPLALFLPARAQAPAATPADAVVLIRTVNSLRAGRGSGFLIGDGSWVVTASHVVSVDLGKGRRVSDQTALVYSPWTGRAYEAKVAAIDGVADIALLRMPQPGLPSLPVEGLALKEADAALAALKDRPLRLFGFPLSYGEGTVAALAKAEFNDSKLDRVAKRGETSLCVLGKCPDVQPGWSGGPVVAADRGTVVGVFHSLYRQKESPEGLPAGSLAGYLGDLLRTAGARDVEAFARGAAPAIPRPADAAERMAHEMRSLSWSSAGLWKKAEEEQRALLKLGDDALVRVELGRLLLAQQKYPEALKELQAAVRLAPKSVTAQLQLARACHLNYDPKGAMAAIRAALEASPAEVEPQLTLAEIYEENQKADEAEKVLRAAMQAAPQHPAVVYRLGSLLIRRGTEADGLKLLSQASEMSLADPILSAFPLGYARALDTARKYREAEGIYRLTIRADPENALAHYYLAQLMLRTRRGEEAQIWINNAFKIPRLSEEMVQALRVLQLRINERAGGD